MFPDPYVFLKGYKHFCLCFFFSNFERLLFFSFSKKNRNPNHINIFCYKTKPMVSLSESVKKHDWKKLNTYKLHINMHIKSIFAHNFYSLSSLPLQNGGKREELNKWRISGSMSVPDLANKKCDKIEDNVYYGVSPWSLFLVYSRGDCICVGWILPSMGSWNGEKWRYISVLLSDPDGLLTLWKFVATMYVFI